MRIQEIDFYFTVSILQGGSCKQLNLYLVCIHISLLMGTWLKGRRRKMSTGWENKDDQGVLCTLFKDTLSPEEFQNLSSHLNSHLNSIKYH